jgi:hypothetical protein
MTISDVNSSELLSLQANISIESSRGHRLLICGPGESCDRFFVAVEHSDRLSGVDIPNMNLGIGSIASRQQARSIGTKDSVHLVCFNLQTKY